MSHFNTYGRMAEANVDDIIQNGRYYAQAEAEKLIPADVMQKMQLKPSDSFLDVGCGLGINLRAALEHTNNCGACDHENVLAKLQEQPCFSDVNWHPGSFLDVEFNQKFSKILIYGVVPALPK